MGIRFFRFLKSKRLIIILFVLVGLLYLAYREFLIARKEVKTARIEKGTVSEELIVPGEIKAEEHADLSFLSSGELDYVSVSEGQVVKKGDVLAKLDPTNAYQTFLQAEADLRRYEASLQKIYDEIKGHEKDESFAQRETRTIAETNKDKAYRAYVIARQNLKNLAIYAPFDGVITSITHPFSGINVTLSESQIEIVNLKTIYFEISADQTEVTELKLGQKVSVVLDSFPDKEIEGEISFISYTPKAGEAGTVYRVKVKLISGVDIQNVRIGMSGDAKFVISEKKDVLYIPPEFIHSDANGKYINLNSRNNKKYIEVGIEGEKRVEIKGDIKEGEIVYE